MLFSVVKDIVTQPMDNRSVARRHTISACDVKNGRKVHTSTNHVSEYIPEDETDDGKHDTFVRGHASRKATKWVSYRKKHEQHQNVHDRNVRSQSAVDYGEVSGVSHSHRRHVLHDTFSKSQSNLVDKNIYTSNGECLHDMSYRDVGRIARSKSTMCIYESNRFKSAPEHYPHRSVSPNLHARRAESPVRHLSRSETFTCNVPVRSRKCVRNENYVSARCDSPQTRQLSHSDTFPPPRSESPSGGQRPESPRRHSVQIVHNIEKADSACLSERSRQHSYHPRGNSVHETLSHPRVRVIRHVQRHVSNVAPYENKMKHDPCMSPCLKSTVSDRSDSPSCHSNRSGSQSPCQHFTYSSLSSLTSEESCTATNSNFQVKASDSTLVFNGEKSKASDRGKSDEQTRTIRQRPSIIRARSRQEINTSHLKSEEEKHFEIIERTKPSLDLDQNQSENVFKKPVGTRVVKTLSMRTKVDLFTKNDNTQQNLSNETDVKLADEVTEEGHGYKETRESENYGRRSSRLTRQTAIRTGRTDLRKVFSRSATVDSASDRTENRFKQVGGISNDKNVTPGQEKDSKDKLTVENDSDKNVEPSSMHTSSDSTNIEKKTGSRLSRPVRPVIRSRSEVRPRSEVKPLKGSHDLSAEVEKRLSKNSDNESNKSHVTFSDAVQNSDSVDSFTSKNHDFEANDNDLEDIDHTVPEVIQTSRSEFKVKDLLHVSWKSECPRESTNHDPNASCSACRPLPVSTLTCSIII